MWPNRFARKPSVRTGLATLASAVLVGSVVLFGADDGYPATDVRLLSGMAWLSSARVGQITLLDGSSAEVAAQVQVAPAGNTLDVVQHGSTAYAVDKTTGTIRRLDGGTFELTQPEAPIPGANAGLTVFAGQNTLYALDTRRGIVADADPRTATRRGETQTLAAQLADGTAALDDTGRLWLVDNLTGDLTWLNGENRTTKREITKPGRSVLTLANDKPVIVSTTDRRAIPIDPATGTAKATLDLDLRPDEAIQVSGSPHTDRLYIVATRGVLMICDLATGKCDRTVPLEEGSQLGAAVEAGGKLFIPDYTTGRVWIVDLVTGGVSAKPQVITPAGRFELLAHDGMVFFNDPQSDKAGVLQLDGKVLDIAKYDAKDPQKGLNNPNTPAQQPPVQQPPVRQQPTAPVTPPAPQQPTQQQQQPPTQQTTTPNPTQQPPHPDTRITDPPPPPPEKPSIRIVPAKLAVAVNEDLTLQVRSDKGEPPRSAHWKFGDTQEDDGITVGHRWHSPQVFQVSVQATMNDGQTATASVAITVTPKPTFRLTVSSGPGGKITGPGINCTPTCTANFDPGQHVTLTQEASPGFRFEGWGGACSGTEETCEVTMDKAKTVSGTYEDLSAPVIVTMRVSGTGGTARMNGKVCPPACTTEVNRGQNYDIEATPAAGFEFAGWAPPETCSVPKCTRHTEKSITYTATFQVKPPG
jgi:hypothetical protein